MFEADVAPGIHRIEDAYTNWYVVEADDGLTVVDAGVPTSWQSLEEALRKLGRPFSDIRALILTHAHFDHIGVAERLRRDAGVSVFLHEDDVPLSRHPWQYAHERPRSFYLATQVQALPIVASLVRSRAFWPRPLQIVNRFEDGKLDVPGTPTVVRTPGHTVGHVSFHFPDRDVLIAGDAIVTLDPYTAQRGPRLVARAATADVERAARSLDALAETNAKTVLPGHGEPWREGVAEAAELARKAGAA